MSSQSRNSRKTSNLSKHGFKISVSPKLLVRVSGRLVVFGHECLRQDCDVNSCLSSNCPTSGPNASLHVVVAKTPFLRQVVKPKPNKTDLDRYVCRSADLEAFLLGIAQHLHLSVFKEI